MKFLLGIIAVLVLLCSFLGYKTYDLSEKNATLGVALESLKEALKTSEKALETEKQSCSLTDLINTEYQEQKKERADKKDSILDELNKLEANPIVKQETKINEKPNTLELDIDSPLPVELRMLLDKTCNPNKFIGCNRRRARPSIAETHLTGRGDKCEIGYKIVRYTETATTFCCCVWGSRVK